MFSPTDVHSRHLPQKAEKGKFNSSDATTRYPRASCFEEPMRSVPETWGRMYNVLALKKLVSSDIVKNTKSSN